MDWDWISKRGFTVLKQGTMQAVTHHSAPCMILGEDGIATADAICNIEPKVEK